MSSEEDPPKTIEALNEKCQKILKDLHDTSGYDDHKRISDLLSDFRILTREKTLKQEVLDDNCMQMLVDCSKNYHTEAQKCLSNLILNYAHVRENLVQPYVECVYSRLTVAYPCNESKQEIVKKHDPNKQRCEILYYDLRIVFLLSALCAGARASIRDRLLDPILELTKHEAENLGSDNYLLIIEGLKTLFNFTLDKKIDSEVAAQVIKRLFSFVGTNVDRIVDHETGSELDLTDRLLVNLIHLLTNMPEDVYHQLSNDDVDKVLTHLDEQLKALTQRDTVLPVLNACANICKYKDDVRQRWFEEIIGTTKEFEKRPEEYDTLRGRLVKLMTSVDVHIKEIAAEFLFALCGDTEKFITYTGFGNSAAFLASKGLLSQSIRQSENHDHDEQRISEVPESNLEKQYREIRDKLDPITGKMSGPKENPMEGMSEEEKEWHAHELASAIAKLSKIGVMRPTGVNSAGQLSELDPSSHSEKQSNSKSYKEAPKD